MLGSTTHTSNCVMSESFSMTSHIIGGTTKLFNICDVTKKKSGLHKKNFSKNKKVGDYSETHS